MKCPGCGAWAPAGDVVCPSCGLVLPERKSPDQVYHTEKPFEKPMAFWRLVIAGTHEE